MHSCSETTLKLVCIISSLWVSFVGHAGDVESFKSCASLYVEMVQYKQTRSNPPCPFHFPPLNPAPPPPSPVSKQPPPHPKSRPPPAFLEATTTTSAMPSFHAIFSLPPPVICCVAQQNCAVKSRSCVDYIEKIPSMPHHDFDLLCSCLEIPLRCCAQRSSGISE